MTTTKRKTPEERLAKALEQQAKQAEKCAKLENATSDLERAQFVIESSRLRKTTEKIEKLQAEIANGNLPDEVSKDVRKIDAAIRVLIKYGADATTVAHFQKAADLIRSAPR